MKNIETIETAELFEDEGCQAVRLPKAIYFEGSELFVKKVPEGVLLIPKEKYAEIVWQKWIDNLMKYDEPFDIELPYDNPPEEVESIDE